ncbi:MAG: 2-C-methyl-D-erythritol 2,4-cyclodiphosphate synthase [Candidatus Omnitrophota bacterium]
MPQRIGIGYDVHRLAEGRKLLLGGVEIPFGKGLEGHSDADVLLHAVCDALLGAVGEGDIGEHFPNTDERYRGISSLLLLGRVNDLVRRKGYRVVNVDSVILAEEPHLKDYKNKMRSNIAQSLGVDESAVNVKATTQEGLGCIGRGEGLAAYAVVLLTKDG